ncbi:hypothetical protein HJG39_09035 [Alteromonas sp. a30]|nr:hypothetical protein [Alteromonas sp. a30]
MAVQCLLLGHVSSAQADIELTGKVILEHRFFLQDAAEPRQGDNQTSILFEPEIYTQWNDGDNALLFKPFIRLDEQDSERTHGDIRELTWFQFGSDWEVKAGMGKVFWGQTESQHLVDVINQTDSIEAVDGEDKLGQPMVSGTLIRDWGTTSLFVLPYFRERTFPGIEGRIRPQLLVDTDNPIYESSQERHHIDWAARYSHTLGDWDVGLSYFDGTSREPFFIADTSGAAPVLRPWYLQMTQIGVDLLSVVDSWLLKFEGISRDTSEGRFFAMTGGFEYTQVGIMDSVMDVGWLMEYQFDDRDQSATGPGQNDLFVGSRIVFNDVDGTEVLLGYVQDLDDSSSYSAFIEAGSRINSQLKWSLDAWFFSADEPTDLVYAFRRDDFIQLNLEYYF